MSCLVIKEIELYALKNHKYQEYPSMKVKLKAINLSQDHLRDHL